MSISLETILFIFVCIFLPFFVFVFYLSLFAIVSYLIGKQIERIVRRSRYRNVQVEVWDVSSRKKELLERGKYRDSSKLDFNEISKVNTNEVKDEMIQSLKKLEKSEKSKHLQCNTESPIKKNFDNDTSIIESQFKTKITIIEDQGF